MRIFRKTRSSNSRRARLILFSKQFLHKCRDEAAFRETGESFGRHTHDLAHIGRLCGTDFRDYLHEFCLDLSLAELLRKIDLHSRSLGQFVLGQFRTAGVVILLGAFLALLYEFLDYLYDILVATVIFAIWATGNL